MRINGKNKMEILDNLYVERNRIQAQIDAIENEITTENAVIIAAEIANIIDEVGEGYRGSDYYAPVRYYSNCPGVKNIRIFSYDPIFSGSSPENKVVVKIVGKVVLPKTITVRGIVYEVKIIRSNRY